MLPDSKQSRHSRQVTPLHARVMLAGMPKSGKTTLVSEWNPNETLIVDTHKGTTLLDGEHYVSHVATWEDVERVVSDIVADQASGKPRFKTVAIDLIDDIWKMADLHAAQKKGTAEAEGLFRREIGRLLATDLGIWFVSHTDTVEEDKVTRYIPRLDKRVRTYIQGAVQFVLLAETLGPNRVLHTQPTLKFEAGSRVPLPEPMPLDSKGLYAAMAAGLSGQKPKATKATKTTINEQEPIAA
jgi:hypothetical protein